jgi:hypothetical protein
MRKALPKKSYKPAQFGTIAENDEKHIKSAAIAKPGETERGVCPSVRVFMGQPWLHSGENTRIVCSGDAFSLWQ